MRLAFFLFIVALVLGAIFGVISFFIDLLCELFAGAGIYGIITVVGILLFVVSIISITNS